MATSHTHSFLQGTSRWSQNTEALCEGNYDLFITASSWDSRCVCITTARRLQFTYGIYLNFRHKDRYGLRDTHDTLLHRFFEARSKEFALVSGESTNVSAVWNDLYTQIAHVYNAVSRPLYLFMDLSTCPRVYALAILGACIRTGIVKKLSIFYAEGIYELQENHVGAGYAFSSGSWEMIRIPFFEGINDPGKMKYILISVGFEGLKTLQIVNKDDPDRISILFPDPGVQRPYIRVAKKANQELFDAYKVPAKQIIKAAAGDAIAAWRALDTASLERPDAENTSYLCCGTKPHAVGLALRALCLGYPSVLYRVPEKHEDLRVRPSGRYWLYEILDLSSIP